jgi:hypothetical protein
MNTKKQEIIDITGIKDTVKNLMNQIQDQKKILTNNVIDIFGKDLQKVIIGDDLIIHVYLKNTEESNIITEFSLRLMEELGYSLRSIHFEQRLIFFKVNQ